jgi:MYXO-CTERM domain-containing protein
VRPILILITAIAFFSTDINSDELLPKPTVVAYEGNAFHLTSDLWAGLDGKAGSESDDPPAWVALLMIGWMFARRRIWREA